MNFIFFFFFFFFFWGGGGGGQKSEYYFGHEDFVDIFGDHYTTGLVLGVNSMHSIISFLEVSVQYGDIFWFDKIANILLGMPHYS